MSVCARFAHIYRFFASGCLWSCNIFLASFTVSSANALPNKEETKLSIVCLVLFAIQRLDGSCKVDL